MTFLSGTVVLLLLQPLALIAADAGSVSPWVGQGMYAVYEGYAKHFAVHPRLFESQDAVKVGASFKETELMGDKLVIGLPVKAKVVIMWSIVDVGGEHLTLNVTVHLPKPMKRASELVDIHLPSGNIKHNSAAARMFFWIPPDTPTGAVVDFAAYPAAVPLVAERATRYLVNERFGIRPTSIMFDGDFVYDGESGLLLQFSGSPVTAKTGERVFYKEPLYSLGVYWITSDFRLVDTNVPLSQPIPPPPGISVTIPNDSREYVVIVASAATSAALIITLASRFMAKRKSQNQTH
ncbi:MAG: hypothetical protein QXV97_06945 [Candidatus Caldarchaeum sp.]